MNLEVMDLVYILPFNVSIAYLYLPKPHLLKPQSGLAELPANTLKRKRSLDALVTVQPSKEINNDPEPTVIAFSTR